MLKWSLIIVGALLLVVVAALAALPWILNTPAFQSYVAQSAAHALSRPVRFASLSISPFPLPTVKLRGLEIAEDPAFGPGPFLTVSEGRIGLRLRPLLSGRVELTSFTLDEPKIALTENERGRWNWASLGVPMVPAGGTPRTGGRIGTPAAGAVLLSHVRIVNGTMGYRRIGTKGPDVTLAKVNLTVSQTAPGGPLLVSGDAVAQPGNVGLKISEASLTPAGARSFAEMALKGLVDVNVADMGPVGGAVFASPVLAGSMKGQLALSGTPLRPMASGTMGIDRLTFSEERPQCEPRRRQLQLTDLRVPVAYAGTGLVSTPVEAKLARGTVSLALLMTLGPTSTATMKSINVKGVDLGPILVDYLCQPYAVTGPMDLTGQATVRVDDPWHSVNGAGRLRIGPGKVMGRDVVTLVREVVALAGAASLLVNPEHRRPPASPLDFDSITASYTITNGVMKTADLLYQAADVKVAGTGTLILYDGRVDMNVTLTQGPNQVKGTVSGTAGALHVVPTSVRVPDADSIKKLIEKLLR